MPASPSAQHRIYAGGMWNHAGRGALARRGAAVLATGLLFSACGAGGEEPGVAETVADSEEPSKTAPRRGVDAAVESQPGSFRYPEAPVSPASDVPISAEADALIEALGASVEIGALDLDQVALLAERGDIRQAWFIADLLRFFGAGVDESVVLLDAFEQLAGQSVEDDPELRHSPWLTATNHLIAWDTPDYPGYREHKSNLFLSVEPRWEPFFADDDADVDWRLLSWGGVRIDDHEVGVSPRCTGGCIPALDDPAVTEAAAGDWYPDDAIVFGVVEGDDALAIPKHIAEVHEMFNLSLGGRRFAIPYCTLCGSAQAFRTDNTGAFEEPVLRTTGLLSRSNKVMYDLRSTSLFDTFTGAAVSGPLHAEEVVLESATVVVSSWGAWKEAHPDTVIIAEDGGIGRGYTYSPLGGRDDNGPIFPVGPTDARLTVQELVVGAVSPAGGAVAFPSDQASATLAAGEEVEAEGVRLVADGDGLRAVDADTGEPIAAHESFWFAWSQFRPNSTLWSPPS